MKSAVTTTIQISARGTLTLPKRLRHALGLDQGGVVMVETASDGILLRPAVAYPIEMYTDQRVAEFDAADARLAKRLARPRR